MKRRKALSCVDHKCRTCLDCDRNGDFVSLHEPMEHHKSLAEMLLDVVKIDTALTDSQPAMLCARCAERLRDAYEFAQQARYVNACLLDSACLLEEAIDMPPEHAESCLQVKMERDSEADALAAPGLEFHGPSTKNALSAEKIKQEEETPARDSIITKIFKTTKPQKSEKEDANSEISDDDGAKLSRMKTRSRRVKRTSLESRFKCMACDKSYIWIRDLQRHEKTHQEVSEFKCHACGAEFARKEKFKHHLQRHLKDDDLNALLPKDHSNALIFAERLYPFQRFRLRQCKLCDTRFDNLTTMREHMLKHSQVDTLRMLSTEHEVVQEIYPDLSDLDLVKQLICDDIREGRASNYLAIVNYFGYEVDWSESECDSENDAPSQVVKEYKCELCSQCFLHKSDVVRHTKQHGKRKFPYSCAACKIDFVSRGMFEKHKRSQCDHMEKKYKCLYCPGVFMWSRNLTSHQCSGRLQTEKGESTATSPPEFFGLYQCAQCAEIYTKVQQLRMHFVLNHKLRGRFKCSLCARDFERAQQLREHLPTHADGVTDIDRKAGLYFKTFHNDLSAVEDATIAGNIAVDFAAHRWRRFYAAIDEDGFEMMLSDDESKANSAASLVCELCSEEFISWRALLRHQRNQHDSSEDNRQMAHECVNCAQRFVCGTLLDRHILHECDDALQLLRCETCSACFLWQRNLELHRKLRHRVSRVEQVSEVEPTFPCDVCQKVCNSARILERHKRIHLPDAFRFKCDFCAKTFNRKDNLYSHLRVHGVAAAAFLAKKAVPHATIVKVEEVNEQLTKPHGGKTIQCMICLSKHTKIGDLSSHLRQHETVVSFAGRKESPTAISLLLYPEMQRMQAIALENHIKHDIEKGNFDRFYSITNEVGHELSVNSSETNTDSESEALRAPTRPPYVCELCEDMAFPRKYQIYAHQRDTHSWAAAPHVCPCCDARFVSATLLDHHKRRQCNNPYKRFACKKCPQRFQWKDNLNAHLRAVHDIKIKDRYVKLKKTLCCKDCKVTFKMQKDLTRHLIMCHSNDTILKCPFCPRKFYRKENLHFHVFAHNVKPEELVTAACILQSTIGPNGNKTILCRVCNQRFHTIARLREHLRVEQQASTPNPHADGGPLWRKYSIVNTIGFELQLDDSETDVDESSCPAASSSREYRCEMCSFRCHRRHLMAQHQSAMHKHEEITLQCEKCIFRTVSVDIMAHHKQEQCYNKTKRFQCGKCVFRFAWPENLKTHMEILHPNEKDEATTPAEKEASKIKIYECSECNRKYNRKDRLSQHMRRVHLNGAMKNERCPAEGREKRFLCALCGKALTSSSNLIVHMRRHTGERPFKCEYCEMAFPRSSDLQIHRRTHTGERPHKCKECGKAFTIANKLNMHMRVHSGERPYKCTYCDKSFAQSNELTAHTFRHTGERPHVCGICGHGFVQSTRLKKHRIVHGHFEDVKPKPKTRLQQF